MSEGAKGPLKLFYCYANEDKTLLHVLDTHLNVLKRKNLIEVWSADRISAGLEVELEINKRLSTADIILLLVSADFLASDDCYGEEMAQVLQRHEEGTARVIPILLRPVDWQDTPFSKLQALPANDIPLTNWKTLDDACVDIAKELRRVVEELLAAREAAEDGFETPNLEKALHSLPVVLINFNEYTAASKEEIGAYYKGKSLSWEIILAHADVKRDQQQQLIDEYSQPLNKTRMVCLSGEPGAGKSTLARRLAFEIAQRSEQLLIHLPESARGDIWYQLRKVLSPQQKPLLILVDDVFRADDVVSALSSFNLNLNVTIFATTRKNEIPEDLRLPFLQIVELEPPSEHEKTLVTQKLQTGPLSSSQTTLLAKANTWLVLMMELTSGESLEKIVRDSINRLKSDQHGQIVYRAYKYLCYAGQYQLSMPADLLLDAAKESFYRLEEDPRGQGLIVYNELNAAYSTLHPVFAELAFKTYRILPHAVLLDIIDAMQIDKRSHRVFVSSLLGRSVTLGQQEAPVNALLFQRIEKISALLEQCTQSELWYYWRPLYQALHNDEKIALIASMMAKKEPETAPDWMVYLKFVKGARDQRARAIEVARSWFGNHAQDQKDRAVFLTLIEKSGTNVLGQPLIADAALWLQDHPEDFVVRAAYLDLAKKRGNQEHWNRAIEDTTLWLNMHKEDLTLRDARLALRKSQEKDEHRDQALEETTLGIKAREEDFNVCEAYLRLVNARGNQEQWKSALESTALWLKVQPEDSDVWVLYLQMVELHGTNEHRYQALDDAALWLKTQPEDNKVRTIYVRLVEKSGTDEQRRCAIEDTTPWLRAHPEDSNLRKMYVGLVQRSGTDEQRRCAIEDTALWLQAREENIQVRTAYVKLATTRGTPEERKKALNQTLRWLETHSNITPVQNACFQLIDDYAHEERLAYLKLVERRSGGTLAIRLIEDTARWLKTQKEDVAIRAAYLRLVARKGKREHGKIALEDTIPWLKRHEGDDDMLAAYLEVASKWATGEHRKESLETIARWLKIHPEDDRVRATYIWFVQNWAKDDLCATVIKETTRWLKAHPEDTKVRAVYLELIEKRGEKHSNQALEETALWLKDHPEDTKVRAIYLKRVTKQGTPEQQKRAVHETFQLLEMGVSNVQIFIPYFKLIDMWGTPEQCAKIIEMARPCLNAEPHNEFLWATYLLLVVRRGNTEQLTTAHRLAESWLLAHPQSTNTYILDSYGNILLKLGLHQKAEVLFRRVLKRDKSYVPSRIGLGWSLYHQGKKEEAYQTLLYCQQQVESGSKYPIEGIFLNLGQYWMLEGIIDKAIACFQAGIRSNPHYQQYLALGQAFLALKDYTQARQALQKAKDLLSETIALEAHPEIYQEIDLLFADTLH